SPRGWKSTRRRTWTLWLSPTPPVAYNPYLHLAELINNVTGTSGYPCVAVRGEPKREMTVWACPISPDRSDGMIMLGEQSDGTKQKTFYGRVQERSGAVG